MNPTLDQYGNPFSDSIGYPYVALTDSPAARHGHHLLPFTGADLLLIVIAGLLLVGCGYALKRSARE